MTLDPDPLFEGEPEPPLDFGQQDTTHVPSTFGCLIWTCVIAAGVAVGWLVGYGR